MASVIADPAREAMLVALADGRALPAGELAGIAGVSPQSASRHLQKLVAGQLLDVWTQGRFRYYRVASEEIAALLETMCAIANRLESAGAKGGRGRRLPPGFCDARRCYSHLAGRLGVELAAAFAHRGYASAESSGRAAKITASGRRWLTQAGIDVPDRAAFRLCLDGTERRPHFAGPAATALLRYLEEHKLLISDRSEPRVLRMTAAGKVWFAALGIGADASVQVSGGSGPRMGQA